MPSYPPTFRCHGLLLAVALLILTLLAPIAQAAPLSRPWENPVPCMYLPLVDPDVDSSASQLRKLWKELHDYLATPEHSAQQRALISSLGADTVYALTSVYADNSEFMQARERAQQAGIAPGVLEQISLFHALREADLGELKKWLPAAHARLGENYKDQETYLLAEEAASNLSRLCGTIVGREGEAPGLLIKITEKPRLLAYADSVMRDLHEIKNTIDTMSTAEDIAASKPIKEVEWRKALPRVAENNRLRTTGRNIFGDAYGDQIAGQPPLVPTSTMSELVDIFPESAWAPFIAGGTAPAPKAP